MLRPMDRMLKSDDGMTLLELIIAALILTFAISALFGLLLTATNMSVQSKEQNLAVAAANSYLEMVRSLSYSSIGVLGGAGGSIEGTLPVRTVVVNGSFTVTITPSVTWIDDPTIVGAQNYKEVRVVVEVGAPPRTPISRTFATFVRAPGEILAITGETSGTPGGGADPVLEWAEGQTPAAGAIVRGTDVVVTIKVSTPNVGGTIKRVQMFCGVPVLVGTGGGIASNGYTTGEWVDLAQTGVGTYTFRWNTLALQVDGTRWFPDGQRKLYVAAYDNQSRTGTIERWITIDNDAPGALASPPVPTNGNNQDVVVSWGAAKDGTGDIDYASIYEFFPYADVLGATGAGTPPTGWTAITHLEVTPVTLSAPSYTWTGAQAFNRYWFSIRAENAANMHGPLSYEVAVPVVTRPKVKGTFKNSIPSNNKTTTEVTLTVSPPKFTTTALSYRLWRSADRASWTAVGTASSGPTVQYSEQFNDSQFGLFYYKVVATFTPGGLKNAVSQTVETKALGPVPKTSPAGPTTLTGSDTF